MDQEDDCAVAQREPERFEKQKDEEERDMQKKKRRGIIPCTGAGWESAAGKQKYREGPKLWVDTKWILSQQNALGATKPKSSISCRRKSLGSTSREVLIPLSQPWSAWSSAGLLKAWTQWVLSGATKIIKELQEETQRTVAV